MVFRKKMALASTLGLHFLLIFFLFFLPESVTKKSFPEVINIVIKKPPLAEETGGADRMMYHGVLDDNPISGLSNIPGETRQIDLEGLKALSSPVRNQPGKVDLPPSLKEDDLFIPSGEEVLFDLPRELFEEEEGEGNRGLISGIDEINWRGQQRVPLSNPPPPFPEILLTRGMETELEIKVVISPGGNVVYGEILKGSGYNNIDVSVLEVIKGWLFEPSESETDDEAVIPVRFRLKKGDLE